jgi:hypothetical protein
VSERLATRLAFDCRAAIPEAFAAMTASTVRLLGSLAMLALLGACSQTKTASITPYYPPPHRDFKAPGPASDPWGPYIVEAARKYDVPERWVREVMKAESGGRLYENGTLITSAPGAMGLMQVMPGTYTELRGRYNLGDDPYEPHDNIMAGTAYLREMYDVYGAPGFLAAYNAGPGRLEDYILRNKELPLETRRYVAKIGPNILGHTPLQPSGAVQFWQRGPVQTAVLSAPAPAPAAPPPTRTALSTQAPPAKSGGFHLITPAVADTLSARQQATSGMVWAIQVGAYANEGLARAAAESARGSARDLLGTARPAIGVVQQPKGTLYRARLAGLTRDTAMQACSRLAKSHNACIVISPESQS